MLGNSGPPIARMLPAQTHAGVWNSYAVPSNNLQLWSSVWNEDTEPGVCTGLSPSQWMRRAVQLRDQYNPDVRRAVHAVHAVHAAVQSAGPLWAWRPRESLRIPACLHHAAGGPKFSLRSVPCCFPCARMPRSGCSRTPASPRAVQPQPLPSWMRSVLPTAATCTWPATRREL